MKKLSNAKIYKFKPQNVTAHCSMPFYVTVVLASIHPLYNIELNYNSVTTFDNYYYLKCGILTGHTNKNYRPNIT